MPAPTVPQLPGDVGAQRPSPAAEMEHAPLEPVVPAVGRRRRAAGAALVHRRRVGDLRPAGALCPAVGVYRVHAPGVRGRPGRQQDSGARLRFGAGGE